jgi:hypothetical protein
MFGAELKNPSMLRATMNPEIPYITVRESEDLNRASRQRDLPTCVKLLFGNGFEAFRNYIMGWRDRT